MIRFLIHIAFFFTVSLSLNAQVLLQLERSNTTKVKRYLPGNYIRFKTRDFPNKWQQGEIDQLLYQERALVFADRITYLKDITHVSYERRWTRGLGRTVTQFGVVWLSLAAISEGAKAAGVLRSRYDVGTDTIAIGLGAILTGLILDRGFGTAVKPINGTNRLRILDLNF